jgi:hypothetical protein
MSSNADRDNGGVHRDHRGDCRVEQVGEVLLIAP